MKKITTLAIVSAVLLLASAARAGIVTLVNTAADQTIVDDSVIRTGSDDMRNFGGDGTHSSGRLEFYKGLEKRVRASVLRFNNIAGALPALVVADPTKITKVTLTLYQEYVGYSSATQPDNVSFYRVKKSWDEGTRVYTNTSGSVDGVSSRTRHTGVENPPGWTRTGGTNFVWELPVAQTVYEAAYKTNAQPRRFAVQTSIAEVDAGIKRWWYDTSSQKLYVNKNDDGSTAPDVSSTGVCYYLADQVWEDANASGDTDCDKVNAVDIPRDSAVGGWNVVGSADNAKFVFVDSDMDVDLLDWVRGWVGGTYDNNGMVFAKGLTGNEWNYRAFTTSDSTTYTNGPKLTIEYVPEPATMGLLGLGFAGMAMLRRRRSRRSA